MKNKIAEEINLDKAAWQAWEKANYESTKGINPHAYIIGFKDCYEYLKSNPKTHSEAVELEKLRTNLHIEENNSVANENVFNAENYHGSKEHFNDIANGRD